MSHSLVSVKCSLKNPSAHRLNVCFFVIVNRWKGENVATTEVADVITQADCIREANVYGVEVPGNSHCLSSFLCVCLLAGTVRVTLLQKHKQPQLSLKGDLC